MEKIRARGQEWNKSTLLASLWKKKTNQKEEKQQTARTKLLQSGCCLSKVHRWLFVSRTNVNARVFGGKRGNKGFIAKSRRV